MSEFLAEASVVVRPDTTKFRTLLQAELRAATRKPLVVPVLVTATGTGSTTAASGAAAALGAAQARAAAQTAGATKAQDDFRKSTAGSTAAMLGAASATQKLDAALLGLRTVAGSSAVIGLGALALSAIVVGKAFRSIVGLTVDFETQLNTFQATTSATASEMRNVAEAAKELGADITLPAVSAGDAAQAMTELAKAGLSVEDSIDGARGVLQLGTAANIAFADSVELAANALNAFGLGGRDAVRVADVFANAANSAQGSIRDIGISLQQAAAVGAQAGISFEDTTLFLTLLAKAGLRGSDAGTSLRVALIRLINPTAEAAAKIKDLGIQIRDQAGNIRPDVFIQFAEATKGLTPAARDAALALVGGQDALRAFAILGRTSIKDFIALRKELRQQGTAADVAAARTKGLGGAAQALQSTLQTVAITMGSRVSPGFTDFVNSVTASINAIADSDQVARAFNNSLSLVGSTLSTIGTAASTAVPPLLAVAGAAESIVNTIGITQILAAVVAYKAYGAAARLAAAETVALTGVLGAARTAMATFAATSALAGGSLRGALAGARVGFSALGASLASFATSTAGIGIAVAGLTAGLLFLVTRDSQAARATKLLTTATNELVVALGDAEIASKNLSSLRTGAESQADLANVEAQLAEARARGALANSNAARGSLERRQLEFSLAVAIDDVAASEQRLLDVRKDLANAQEADIQARKNLSAARQKEAEGIQAVIDAEKAQAIGRATPVRGDPAVRAAGQQRLLAKAVEDSTKKFQEQADANRKLNTDESRDLAKRLGALATIQKELKKFATPTQIKLLLNSETVEQGLRKIAASFGITGKLAVEAFVRNVLKFQSFETPWRAMIHRSLVNTEDEFLNAGAAGGKAFGDAAVTAAENALKRLRGQVAGLGRKALDLEIAQATPQARLSNLRDQEAAQRKLFEGLKPGPAKNQAREDLAAIVSERVALEEQLANDAEAAAREIEQARKDSFTALLGIFDTRQNAAQQAILDAQQTASLNDDIKAERTLRRILLDQVAVLRKKAKTLDSAKGALAAALDAVAQAEREIKDLLRQRRRDALSRQQELLDLDLQIAQTTGNVSAQRQALKAEIKFYQGRIDATRRGSVERKRWILLLRQAQEELKELKGVQKETNNEAAEFFFEQLQAQQGFAANLMGNLITGPTSGLVGVPAPPSQGVRQAAAVQEGKAQTFPTSGQANTEISVLEKILMQLRILNGSYDAPEAITQKKSGLAIMDGIGGV